LVKQLLATLTVTPVSSNITSITSPTGTNRNDHSSTKNLLQLWFCRLRFYQTKIEYKVTLSNDNYVLYEANYVKNI
jgi:hypothetical protein